MKQGSLGGAVMRMSPSFRLRIGIKTHPSFHPLPVLSTTTLVQQCRSPSLLILSPLSSVSEAATQAVKHSMISSTNIPPNHSDINNNTGDATPISDLLFHHHHHQSTPFPSLPPASLHRKMARLQRNTFGGREGELGRKDFLSALATGQGRQTWHLFLYLHKWGNTNPHTRLLPSDYLALLPLLAQDRIPSRGYWNAVYLRSLIRRRPIPWQAKDAAHFMRIQQRNRDIAGVVRTFEECVATAATQSQAPPSTSSSNAPVMVVDAKLCAILLCSLVELHDPMSAWTIWNGLQDICPAILADPACISALLYGLGKAGHIDMAVETHASLPQSLRDSPMIRQALIRAYGTSGRLVEAVSLFESIPQERTMPDYDAILEATAYAGNLNLSEAYFEAYRDTCKRERGQYSDNGIITRMMELYYQQSQPQMVERLLYVKQATFPAYRQYELAIRALVAMERRAEAHKLFDKMCTIGFYPDRLFLE